MGNCISTWEKDYFFFLFFPGNPPLFLWFHPRRCGSPNATNPEQVLRHHRSAQERYGGDRHCPLLHRTCILNFISREEEFPRARHEPWLKDEYEKREQDFFSGSRND